MITKNKAQNLRTENVPEPNGRFDHPTSPSSPLRHHTPSLSRRTLLSTTTTATLLPLPSSFAATTTPPIPTPITDRVFLDFSLCPSYLRSDRPLGSDLGSCPDPDLLGRVVFGLYGKLVPVTVANFKAMCVSEACKGALIHKLIQGHYFASGRQGRREKGEVRVPDDVVRRNVETVDPKAFELRHERPGTLSLCLEENDDYEDVRLNPEYRNVEYWVTTGPGPCPRLDNGNIVFGTVLEGLDVVTKIASIPTYKPAERIRQFNDLAEFFGDERAQNARTMWNRPLKTIYISDCGELKVTKPSLTPILP